MDRNDFAKLPKILYKFFLQEFGFCRFDISREVKSEFIELGFRRVGRDSLRICFGKSTSISVGFLIDQIFR